MTAKRRIVSATAALALASSLSVAPAYAGGITNRQALALLEGDANKLTGSVLIFDHEVQAYAKNPNNHDYAGLIGPTRKVVKATATFGHEIRTQRWPGAYGGNVEVLATATVVLRKDFQEVPSLYTSVGKWQVTLDNDLNTWSDACHTLEDDLSDQNG